MSENLDNKSEVVVQAQDFPTAQETAVDPVVFTPQVPAADDKSRPWPQHPPRASARRR